MFEGTLPSFLIDLPIFNKLSNRFQSYKINNTLETLTKDIADVLRASQLVPFLFNICINDIFLFLENFSLGFYVDDSTLYVHNKILETAMSHLKTEFLHIY